MRQIPQIMTRNKTASSSTKNIKAEIGRDLICRMPLKIPETDTCFVDRVVNSAS